VLIFPIVYTVTVVVVPGVPTASIDIPYIGTLFQVNRFIDREPHLVDWKLLGKAASYYNAVASPDLWYFKAVSSNINSLNQVVTKVHDNDEKFMKVNQDDDYSKKTSLKILCAETVSSEEKEHYRGTTKKDQSPNFFSLSYWVYNDLMIFLGYDVQTISFENAVGNHYPYHYP
jgi:hypothetical protein